MTTRHLKGRTRDFLPRSTTVHLDWRVTDWLRGWLRIVLPSLLCWRWQVKSAIIIMSLLRGKGFIPRTFFCVMLMAQLWTSSFWWGCWCVFLDATSNELVEYRCSSTEWIRWCLSSCCLPRLEHIVYQSVMDRGGGDGDNMLRGITPEEVFFQWRTWWTRGDNNGAETNWWCYKGKGQVIYSWNGGRTSTWMYVSWKREEGVFQKLI